MLSGCADLGGGRPSTVAKSKTPHSGLSDLGTIHIKVTAIKIIIFADGTVGPTISLASVATGAGEDDDQSDSDYGKSVD